MTKVSTQETCAAQQSHLDKIRSYLCVLPLSRETEGWHVCLLLEAGRENAAGRRKFLQPPQGKRPERGERKAGQDLGLWVPSFILLRNPVT